MAHSQNEDGRTVFLPSQCKYIFVGFGLCIDVHCRLRAKGEDNVGRRVELKSLNTFTCRSI
jgi:hypothetical protein